MTKRLAIVGSRDYSDLDLVRAFVARLSPTTVVVSGGARGVDAVAIQAAHERGLAYEVFPVPEWEWRKSRGAGFARNERMIATVDGLAAFWDGRSGGTAHALRFAQQRGIWYHVYLPNSKCPTSRVNGESEGSITST